MMVNINTSNFPKGMSTLAMQSNGPLPQIIYHSVVNTSPILSGQNVTLWFLMCSISENIITILAIVLTS